MRLPCGRLVFSVVFIFAAFRAFDVAARTWHVAKDGTGDFSVIQQAVNAAADGDSILIGPGRYNEGEIYTCPGWTEFVRVLVTKSNLTFIGSGPTTIIGQEEPWELSQGNNRGIEAIPFFGCHGSIRVENVRFEGMYRGINTEYIEALITGCEFSGICFAIYSWENTRIDIQNCQVSEPARDGSLFSGHFHEHYSVRNCSFDLPQDNYWPVYSINLWGVGDAQIEDCRFTGGYLGINLYLAPPTLVRSCVFDGQDYFAIRISDSSIAQVDSCVMRNQNIAVYSNHMIGDLVMTGSQVENVTECSIWIAWPGTHTIQDCDLAKGTRGTIWTQGNLSCQTAIDCDMTDNYWGTDNPDSIRAWIQDINDSNQACIRVDFEPFRSESTPTERTSLGGMKALFR